MVSTTCTWEKLGRLLKPDTNISWMSTYTGPSFAFQREASLFDIYVTGRDSLNRSRIGRVKINIESPEKILEVTPKPVFELGERGAFDENGVSYPWLVEHNGKVYMYYVGWMPTVLTPFQNHIGLAVLKSDNTFERVSKAPILERNNEDFLWMGSVSVMIEKATWRMWYTSLLRWGRESNDHKHCYVIKYAESKDGINWLRNNIICINFKTNDEYAIGKPCVLKIRNKYHMWYSYRGKEYRIGYAISDDGIKWDRRDEDVGIDISKEGWDSRAICYAHVISYKDKLYMFYNGNDYGKDGLGLARLDKSVLL